MGKLKELWTEYKTATDAQEKQALREKIWGIEDWMIANHIGGMTARTDFKAMQGGKTYKNSRFVYERTGKVLNPEPWYLYGKDMCKACRYNLRSYCNPRDEYGHMARV